MARYKPKSAIEGVVWPPVSTGAPAATIALARTLEKTEWLKPEEIAARQQAQLRLLIDHLLRHAAGFRRRLEQAGLAPADLLTPEGFKRLPPLQRHEIQKEDNDLFCNAVPKGHEPVGVSTSSGSTGQKVIVRKTGVTQLIWMGMTVRNHMWAGRDIKGRLACILANAKTLEERPDWSMPMGMTYETGPMLMIPVVTDIAEQARLIRAYKADYIMMSPSNLSGLIDACVAGDGPITGLKSIITVNETLKPELRARAESYFGAKIDDIYSSAEIGNMAFQCPQSGLYHVMAENVILEIVDEQGRDCKPGEIGRVLATDLQNFSMPLLRYEIADYAEACDPCPCGRGLPTFRRVMGRERNLAVRPDGSRFWPPVGMCDLHEVAPVLQFQYIQHAPNRIELRLVVSRPVTPAEEDAIRERIHTHLKYPYTIDLVYFTERFARQPSGKFEEFICKVPV